MYLGTVFACNTEAQTHLVKATSAVERAVFVTMHWVSNIKPSSNAVSQTAEELKAEVKKIGGYLQLLIQVLTETVMDLFNTSINPFTIKYVDVDKLDVGFRMP